MGPRVDSVSLDGANSIDVDELTSGLDNGSPTGLWPFRKYDRYDEIGDELDKGRIITFYRKRGYFSVTVEGPREIVDGDEVDLIWTINEGPVTKIQGIGFIGLPQDPLITREKLVRVSQLKNGEPMLDETYVLAKKRLAAALVESGYAHAKLRADVEVNRIKATAKIRFFIDAGPPVKMVGVKIIGLDHTPESAVLNRQTFKRGDLYDPDLLEKWRASLYQTGLYGGIRMQFVETSTPSAEETVLVDIVEAERNELQVGVGGGRDNQGFNVHARFIYSRRTFPFDLATTRFELQPKFVVLGAQRGFTPEARMTMDLEDFATPLLRLSTSLGYAVRNFEAYNYTAPDIGITLSRPFLDESVRMALALKAAYYQFAPKVISEVAAQYRILGDDPLLVVYLNPSVSFDQRDDPVATTQGLYINLGFEVGYDAQQKRPFIRTVPEARFYVPISKRLVIASRLRFGAGILRRDLPAPLSFWAGGASSQRGFSQRRLAIPVRKNKAFDPARDEPQCGRLSKTLECVPIGGDVSVEGNVEARFRIIQLFGFWFGAAVFVDAANVGADFNALSPTKLHWATGGGIRYYTPIGAIRADFGFRLNRTGPNDLEPGDRWAYHITLGEAF